MVRARGGALTARARTADSGRRLCRTGTMGNGSFPNGGEGVFPPIGFSVSTAVRTRPDACAAC